METKTTKVIVDEMKLKRLQKMKGLTPEQLIADVQRKGLTFSYTSYRRLLSNALNTSPNFTGVLNAISEIIGCELEEFTFEEMGPEAA